MNEACIVRCGSYKCLQVAVVLSEKVDTTLSKGVLRIGGTVVGGSLGEHKLLLALTWSMTVSKVTVRPLPSRLACKKLTAGPRNASKCSWCQWKRQA